MPASTTPHVREGTTQHAREKYLPGPRPREGIGLCLSGGGFRAALFHLGATRRLNELGVLSQIDAFSAVSGGSIFAAHLAARLRPWPQPGTVLPADEWESRVAAPFRAYARKDLRTLAILRGGLDPRRNGADYLAANYEKNLTSMRLHELPERPAFTFCATDLSYGVNWTFTRDRMGDYQAGYMTPPPEWTVARAVAASSCFPPVFSPMHLHLKPADLQGGKAEGGPERDACIRNLRLTDGGLYDNMGLEPVWKTYRTVLVSDGGSTFDHKASRTPVDFLFRYLDVQGGQAGSIRKRWLIANYALGLLEGTYWGIGSAAANYRADAPGYPKRLVDDVVSEVRTDMDAFSEAEVHVLENHGYLMADVALRQHAPKLATNDAPLAIPHPAAMDEGYVRQHLAQSHRRKYIKLP